LALIVTFHCCEYDSSPPVFVGELDHLPAGDRRRMIGG
jgi:hypothetical protein